MLPKPTNRPRSPLIGPRHYADKMAAKLTSMGSALPDTLLPSLFSATIVASTVVTKQGLKIPAC